ncbi:hypothetical protein BJX76DRAFT_309930 [Aspergillus varians]
MDDRCHRRSRMHRAVGANSVLTLLCILPFISQGFAQTPYTPTSLLYSSQHNGSFAYLLRTSERRTEFLSLDLSKKIDTDDPSYTVLLDETPFNDNDEKSASIPAIDQHGVIKAYTGDCRDSGNPPTLWTFKPNSGSSIGNGTWEKFSVHESEGHESSATTRPNYLSAGFTFSVSNITESSLFAFAGMCPGQSDTSYPWASAANYSQTMTVLDPCEEESCYQVSTTGNRAPPIPEAGFTITPLQATHGYVDGKLRQQQDFLLIGGHTQQAFINMSELAIFSAPQNSWSFVTVGSETGMSRTDLASRDTARIEPRSGHTAVLSQDGSKVIVFGGWVGNTSVAASPQIAILEIGENFLGSGEWTWSVPSTSGVPDGSGIYGHGATMLPGGIMMVAGGYKTSRLSKRSDTGPELNSQVYLYDVTSKTWASSYKNPYFNPTAEAVDNSSESESSSSSSRKTGLGVGIGLGVPAAAGLGVLLFYFCRRRGARRTRDNEIRKLALGAQRAHFWGRGDSEMASSIRNPSMRESVNSDSPWNGNNKPQSTGKTPDWNDNGDIAAESTGLLGDIHVPKKLNRPMLNAGVYRPPYHEYRRGDATGIIHPIDEREEDEADRAERRPTRETADSLTEQVFATARNTQVDTLQYPGAEPGAGGGGKGGRLSPDKDERTSSSLSDSVASETSAKSSTNPNNSTTLPANRTLFLDKHTSSYSHNREAIRSQGSSTSATSTHDKRYSSESYSTAHSTMSQRQGEREYLLSDSDNHESSPMTGLFNSKPAALTRPKAAEWIGGIRRVLSVSLRRPPANEGPGALSRASGIDGGNSVNATHTADSRFPRRSVSASAELFRRKQGAKDWGVGNRISQDIGFQSARSTWDDFGLDGHMSFDSDGEWDVEGAAEGRRVQVTFTAPREKLRVVNATAGDMDDLSVNSVSRNNSAS